MAFNTPAIFVPVDGASVKLSQFTCGSARVAIEARDWRGKATLHDEAQPANIDAVIGCVCAVREASCNTLQTVSNNDVRLMWLQK